MTLKFSYSLRSEDESAKAARAELRPSKMYYMAYRADVQISDGVTDPMLLPNVPMLYFVTLLYDLMVESFILAKVASDYLWDTGHEMSLYLNGDTVTVEIPAQSIPRRFGTSDFILGLRAVTLEVLWRIYDDNPGLLREGNLFKRGSVQQQIAQLIVDGKAPRNPPDV